MDRSAVGLRLDAHATLAGAIAAGARMRGFWQAVARRPRYDPETGLYHMDELWTEKWENLVVNQGLNNLLGVHLHADTQITTWYLALLKTGGGSIAASSTYQNFMGTSNQEVTAYDEAARQAFVEGAPSGQSLDNVGNEAVFTIDTNSTTVGGAALVSSSTKGDNGAGPFMYAGGAFTAGDKGLDDNDTLTVTATFTAADDGA